MLVGNLPREGLEGLIETYLASIPTPSPGVALPHYTRQTVTPLNVVFPAVTVKKTLRMAMVEELSM